MVLCSETHSRRLFIPPPPSSHQMGPEPLHATSDGRWFLGTPLYKTELFTLGTRDIADSTAASLVGECCWPHSCCGSPCSSCSFAWMKRRAASIDACWTIRAPSFQVCQPVSSRYTGLYWCCLPSLMMTMAA